MKKRNTILAVVVVLLVALLGSACSSGEHMYKHRRSDCDCPTF